MAPTITGHPGIDIINKEGKFMDIYLHTGDRLPAVVSAQILLKQFVDPTVNVTGQFENSTRNAILKMATRFYRPNGNSITGQGWLFLLRKSGLKVIDVIDGADPAQVSTISAIRMTQGAYPGAHMILNGPASNSIGGVVSEIVKFAGISSIMLLRFHGHGAPGYQGVSSGKEFTPAEKNAINIDKLKDISSELNKISPCFVSFGSVELHGCETGQGPKGSQLLQKLAMLWGVPVSAGTTKQVSGGMGSATFRFEGKPVIKTPLGGALEGWAKAVEHTGTFTR